tara:strand:- start:79 stop:615 length:537 start_codon:yes stop_codon:yes gene_type:complete
MDITKDIFNTVIKSPNTSINNIKNPHILELKAKFPYCELIHNLSLLKAHKTNNITFTDTLATCTIYSSNRKNLFHLIHPKKNITQQKEKIKKTAYLFEEWLKNKPESNCISNDALIEKSITKSTQDNNFLTTETLANIYIEQGHFERAIQAYEILCLKYPKKSSFFANQIKKIKNKLN